MAEPGRTVRVSGLPTDIEEERLRDKLCIHFLRSKNGGGEIESVTIVKATPVSALITFEDSRVAQKLIQDSCHTLKIDGKKYEVTVTEHRESIDPDKVIVNVSATVDYSQLPGGVIALASLQRSNPEIELLYSATEDMCTLRGAYTKVQAAFSQLFGHPVGPESAKNKDSGQPATSGSRPAQVVQKPPSQGSEDQNGKPKQKRQREKARIGRPADEYNASAYRDQTPGGYSGEDTGQTAGAASQPPGHPSTSEEDFLIVDADMFQYLQKHCRKEYQRILSKYGVEVVDETNQGLTTLFLKAATSIGDDGQSQELLKLARKAISRLYEENETKICRSQLSKSILPPRGELQRAVENLSIRFPKLLLNEDNQNIYFIGSNTDVSEAKLFLLTPYDVKGKKDDVASLLKYPSYDSSPLTQQQRGPLTMSSTGDYVDEKVDQLLRSEEDERRAEGARKYKLAARFKDSGLPALGSRPTDFTLRGGLSSSSRQTRLRPMLGHDVLSDTAETAGERVSRAAAQNTGGDILFQRGDSLPSPASMQNKTSLNSHLFDTRPKSSPLSTTSTSTTQSSLTERSPFPPAGSGSTLRRSSSFSGTPQEKPQVTGQKSQDDSAKSPSRARARSSSFSNQAGRDKHEVYTAEIKVSYVLWQHIKEAYRIRLDDLTSDVQLHESRSEGSSNMTVTIRGASSSKVLSCHQGLQKLVDLVNGDFTVQDMRLSELGITDAADENLHACCDEVRSRLRKVSIHIVKKHLYLLGPEQLCSQVAATLREVFSGDLAQLSNQQDSSFLSSSSWNSSTETNEDPSNPQVMPETGTGSRQETNHRSERGTESVNGSDSQPLVRKDPVIKEKVKIVGTMELDEERTDTFLNHSGTGNDKSARHVNGTTARTVRDMGLQTKERTMHLTEKDSVQQRQTRIQDSREQSRSDLAGPGCICVCGESEKLMTRTKCGATLCAKCLETVHIHCRVCHETEPKPRGIQGEMSTSKLRISLTGHKTDSAIKITYLIPNGIQDEVHPAPGKPFEGGVFEAYLPDCERTSELLPRLEEAFRRKLTFTVVEKETGGKVTWDGIPHKTRLQGGKTGNGYPDSTYLTRLSEVLNLYGI